MHSHIIWLITTATLDDGVIEIKIKNTSAVSGWKCSSKADMCRKQKQDLTRQRYYVGCELENNHNRSTVYCIL